MKRSSDPAWIMLLGMAFGYNAWAGRSGRELLSSGARRHRAAHPIITRLFIVALIGHLTGWVPHWIDLFHVPYCKILGNACRGDSW